MRNLRFMLGAILFSNISYAGVAIYRDPSSLYNSGAAQLEPLQKNTKRVISKTWLQVSTEGKSGWVRRSLVGLAEDFAKEAQIPMETPLRAEPHWDLRPYATTEEAHIGAVLSISEDWAKVRIKNRIAWIPTQMLELRPELFHFALIKAESELKQKPDFAAKTILRLKPTSRVTPLNFAASRDLDESWLRIKVKNHEGFLPINQLVTIADLSSSFSLAAAPDRWFDLLRVENGWLQSFRGERHPIALAKYWKSSSGVVLAAGANLRAQPDLSAPIVATLSPLQILKIQNSKTVKWTESYLPQDGSVWWKESDRERREPSKPPGPSLTTAQLFGRALFDIATSPLTPSLMVAAADGIFITRNGETWQKLPEFESQNHPVAFSHDGALFIGTQKSEDGGRTFTPYLRWDSITSLVKKQIQSVPSHMRLVDIQNREKSKDLVIEVDVGQKRILQLSTRDSGTTWHFEGARTRQPSKL